MSKVGAWVMSILMGLSEFIAGMEFFEGHLGGEAAWPWLLAAFVVSVGMAAFVGRIAWIGAYRWIEGNP